VTGAYASAADMASTADVDNMMVEVISIVFIFVILLIAFRSVLIPVFLVLVIKAAIYINVGYDFYFGEDMIFLTPVLVNSIQLGATVDYAILFTSRYVEFRRDAADAKEAIRQTIAAASRPMLTSVLTFYFATLSITMISSIKATREISSVVGRGALISFVVIMFALPALFILFDKPLRATTLSLRKKKDRG
jgi:predicted RND superfamily exporter protein